MNMEECKIKNILNNEKQGTGNRHNLWRFFSAGKSRPRVKNKADFRAHLYKGS